MDRLRHPSRALILAQFPKDGLLLDPKAIKSAIETQLNTHDAHGQRLTRPSREGERSITGTGRILRADAYPYMLYTSYNPDGLSPIPDPEVYRAMSYPRELAGKSMDLAEGIWLLGERGDYSALVQAFDPIKPMTTTSYSYEHNRGVMPASAPDNHRVAALRTLIRLGLF